MLILVSDLPGRLLPTIRSRCQQVGFAIPGTDDALEWLRERRPPQAKHWNLLTDLSRDDLPYAA